MQQNVNTLCKPFFLDYMEPFANKFRTYVGGARLKTLFMCLSFPLNAKVTLADSTPAAAFFAEQNRADLQDPQCPLVVPRCTKIIFRGVEVHPSHRLRWNRGIIYCAKCGAPASSISLACFALVFLWF